MKQKEVSTYGRQLVSLSYQSCEMCEADEGALVESGHHDQEESADRI